MVYEAARTVNIPVIGMGGISSGSDVIEFLLAGAAAVQVGTASYFDPCATEHIVDQLYRWCLEHRIKDIKELIGGLQVEA
jgi:dihydroorotate dehydrogenase (NAD+) catalytic subunit